MTRARHYRRRRGPAIEPWTNEPVDAVELLGQLVGRTTYVTPRGGGDPRTPPDSALTGALGMMPDKVQSLVVMAVGGRHLRSESEIHALAHARVMASLQRAPQLRHLLDHDADRHRIRMVMRYALADLVFPERRRPIAEVAAAVKMRRTTYCALQRHIDAWFAAQLADGRREFRVRLWAEEVRRSLEARNATQAAGTYGVLLVDTTDEEWRQLAYLTGASPGAIASSNPMPRELTDALGSIAPNSKNGRQTVHVAFSGRTISIVVDRW